ncbi:hypothetical protein A7985_13690 [Pseudoalteromonas luteoviolacea]|uniref:HD domain-containing protein n=1 Tax=Pseudoalteromonas luteoviolacea TaxID=43657 RepID=A0A1C0TPI8_9GAMM|nr:AAA family ATPase [Pseudoalteromonas luteoviolacea]OCQ20844.1 hypothetical protein A7985_13690 [Pseudoalteromonas luteoviolacea]
MSALEAWLNSLTQDHTPDFQECLDYLADYFPLLLQFEDTEQDPIWHAEGNVAIHTDMVLKALYTELNNEACHIKGVHRQALILGALLHDIAKPRSTRRKEIAGIERVVAPRHEEMGASYLATRLIALPLAYSVISTVMGLVGFHNQLKLLVIKNQSYGDYLHLALNANLELLYWLEVADMKGRTCDDLALQLGMLEEFKMFAQDYELWGLQDHATLTLLSKIQVKKVPSQQTYLSNLAISQLAHGQISTIEEAIAKNYDACQSYSHLYVMCGISGSGKSTWIKKHLAGFEVISLDGIRQELNGHQACQKNRGQVLQLAKKRLKQALAKKRNVVWDATNIRKDFRSIVCDLGRNYGALVTLVAFQLSDKSLRRNNQDRRFSVDNQVISEQIGKLQWPCFNEAHRFLLIGNKGVELARRGTFDSMS